MSIYIKHRLTERKEEECQFCFSTNVKSNVCQDCGRNLDGPIKKSGGVDDPSEIIYSGRVPHRKTSWSDDND